MIDLVADLDIDAGPDSIAFEGTIKSYLHIHLKSLRYGAGTAHRSQSARYVYMGACVSVEIQYIFHVQQESVRGYRTKADSLGRLEAKSGSRYCNKYLSNTPRSNQNKGCRSW